MRAVQQRVVEECAVDVCALLMSTPWMHALSARAPFKSERFKSAPSSPRAVLSARR